MNYGLDMPPYQEIADWLDDDGRIHSCKFRSAYAGFEIMMALSRSAVNGGQVALSLTEAADEVEMDEATPRGSQGLAFFTCQREGIRAVKPAGAKISCSSPLRGVFMLSHLDPDLSIG